MSTSATAPSFNQSDLFAIMNGRLAPIVIVLFGLVFSGMCVMCVLSALHRRRLRTIGNDPRTIALARERARLKEELERGSPIPRMKTVNVEIDLEIGHGVEKGEEGWRGVLPLSLQFTPDYSSSPPAYDDDTKAGKSMPPLEEEPKYVRLTVLVALPSTSGRRHRNDNVILDATLADAQGRPLGGEVECIQHGIPEASIGIYQEKYTGAVL